MSTGQVKTQSGPINYRMPVVRLLNGPVNRGLSPDALLQGVGLTQSLLQDERTVVRGRQFISLLRTITELLQDEFFGLSERRAKPGTYAMMVEIALSCDSLGVAMDRAARFFSLLSEDIELSFELQDENMMLCLQHGNSALDPGDFLTDYLLLSLHRTFSWISGCLVPVKQVQMTAEEAPGPDRIALLLRGDWQAGQPRNAVIMSRRYFDLPLVRTGTEWREHQEMARRGMLNWPEDEASCSASVRRLLKRSVAARAPVLQLPAVASQLGLSAPTLRRRLKEEGTSYQHVLDDFRRSQAIDMLYSRHQTVAEVAQVLGFAEPRSFSRAFKTWTGYSPSAYNPVA